MAEKTKKAPTPELYQIHSTVRDVSTRLKRATSPTRHRFTQLLGGGQVRVIRKRPSVVTKSVIQRLLPELIDREARGLLKVTTMTGQRINLNTFEVVEELHVEEPKPKPPLDTAATDNKYPVGEGKPQLQGGVPETQTLDKPKVIEPELPEGKEPEPELEPEIELPEGEEEDSEPDTKPDAKPRVKRRGKRRG